MKTTHELDELDYLDEFLAELPDGADLTLRRDPDGTCTARITHGFTKWQCSASRMLEALEAARTMYRNAGGKTR